MAFLSADTVQDVAFGVSLVVAGVEIVKAALAKTIASAVAFFVAAASLYGALYL